MGEDKRDSIVTSALQLFKSKGYHNTKVSDIVKEAGIAQGTFYLYFKSKEDLFQSVADQCVQQIAGALERTPSEAPDMAANQTMRFTVRQTLVVYYHNQTILHLIHLHGAGSPELAEMCGQLYSRLASVIIATLKHYNAYPGYTDEQLEFTAYAKIGMVEKAAYHCFIVQGRGPEYIETLTEVLAGINIDCMPEAGGGVQ